MKKVITLFLVVLMVVSLVGCKKGESSNKNTESNSSIKKEATSKKDNNSAAKKSQENEEPTVKNEEVKTPPSDKNVESGEEKSEPLKETPVTEHTISFFRSIPDKFTCSDKSGEWTTTLSINDDGTFNGNYTKKDTKDTAKDFPGGVVYTCDFSGKLSEPVPFEKNTNFSMVEKLERTNKSGDSYIKDGIKYVYAEPFGLEKAKEVIIYTPGAVTASFPVPVKNNVAHIAQLGETLADNMFILHSMVDHSTFVAIKK